MATITTRSDYMMKAICLKSVHWKLWHKIFTQKKVLWCIISTVGVSFLIVYLGFMKQNKWLPYTWQPHTLLAHLPLLLLSSPLQHHAACHTVCMKLLQMSHELLQAFPQVFQPLVGKKRKEKFQWTEICIMKLHGIFVNMTYNSVLKQCIPKTLKLRTNHVGVDSIC